MVNNLQINHAGKLEKNIAKLYIILLSFRMISPFLFIQRVFHAGAGSIDFILHIIGILLILIRTKGVISFGRGMESKLLKSFFALVVYLNISSLIMALVMQMKDGNIGSDSAFDAISGMIVYFFQYAFIFYYNKEVFAMLTRKEIENSIQACIWCLFVIGYIQIAVMNLGGVFSVIYDRFDIFDIFVDSNKLGKLSLTGAEGASAGGIIGVFVIPYLLSGVITKEKSTSEIIQIILWLPILYFTNSSTGYLLSCSVIPAFLIMFFGLNKGIVARKRILVLLVLFLIVLMVILFWSSISTLLPEEFTEQINYLLLEKINDRDNGSTISRTVPIITNFGAFKEYPLFGVGNGCQGYFYVKYFPDWAFDNPGSDVLIFYKRAKETIVNGALFFPSLLSGYGIIGVFLIFLYFLKSNKVLKNKKDKLGRFNYFYWLAMIPIVLYGFQTK